MNNQHLSHDILVAGIKAAVFPDGITAAFDRLKESFPDWNERTLYGLSWPRNGKIVYAAAVSIQNPTEANRPGCETLVIKKGNYIARSLNNWEQNIPAIGHIFDELIHSRPDLEAPCVEWYMGQDVLCMVRITS